MKYFASFIVTLLVVTLPVSVFAQTTPDTLGHEGAHADTSASDASNSVNSELANCGSSNTGGALGQIGSGILGQLLNGSSLGSLLGGNINSGSIGGIISTLTGGNGSSGQIISNLLSGSTAGNISNLLSGQGSGNILSSLFGGSGGISSLFSGSGSFGNLLGGSSGISSILGGSSGISGILGGAGGLGNIAGGALGIVGGALGGGEVPVNDSTVRSTTQKIQGNTKQIQADQDTYIQKVCVRDVLVRQTSTAFTTDFSKTVLDELNTGNAGEPLFSQNFAADNKTLADTVHQDFVENQLPNSGIDHSILQQVQNFVNNKYQSDTQFSLDCPVEDAQLFLADYSKGEGLNTLKAVLVDNPQCTPVGAALAATEQDYKSIATRLTEQEQINNLAEGVFPKIECTDDGGSGKPLQQCINYRIVNPASITNDTAKRGAAAGTEKQARASEIGELVNSLFAQLAQKAFTSLKGLSGLSQKSSTGSGSYLDQVTSNVNTNTIAQGKSALTARIDAALATEYAYQAATVDILGNLDNTKSAYVSLYSCYQTKGSVAGATDGANAASTTIQTLITPQITSQNNALTDSKTIVAMLQSLRGEIADAQSIDDLNAVASAYDNMVSNGQVHSESDVTLAENDRDASETLLNGMILDANNKLVQCASL